MSAACGVWRVLVQADGLEKDLLAAIVDIESALHQDEATKGKGKEEDRGVGRKKAEVLQAAKGMPEEVRGLKVQLARELEAKAALEQQVLGLRFRVWS
jgi:hypothetical protein